MGDSFAERGSLKFNQLLSRGSIVGYRQKSQIRANELGYKQFQRAPFGEFLQSHPRVTFFSAVSDEDISQAANLPEHTGGADVRQAACVSEWADAFEAGRAGQRWLVIGVVAQPQHAGV